MPDAISVERLAKRYTLRHVAAKRYESLSEALSMGARAAAKRLLSRQTYSVAHASDEEFWALKDVSFNVQQGERLGIIGHNGAGKSTLLKIISRITEPTEGRIQIRGRVSSLLEVGTGFHPELTGRENIFLNGTILGMTAREIQRKFDEIVAFAEIERFLDTPAKRYSSGMYVRLAFAVAAHVDPDVLIVDEVLAVGDQKFRQKCLGKMEDLRSSGRTLLFVSHDMSTVRQLCSNVIWLSNGKVIRAGDSASVTAEYQKEIVSDVNLVPIRDRGPISGYHIRRVELRSAKTGQPACHFEAGDTMEIHLWSSDEAPASGYTAEFYLFNERGDRISFGAANPVQNTHFQKHDTHLVCKLGPLPLTSGKYVFAFSIRVWGLERWDYWDQAISFRVTRCDLFGTGHDVPGLVNGDFVMPQTWSANQ
jgi:lipopolysaccharide transport system ATP-binding protein